MRGDGPLRHGLQSVDLGKMLRVCERKNRYPTQEDGELQLVKFLATRSGYEQSRVYACQYCDGWHIGTPQRFTRKRDKNGAA